ncbi:MAG: ribosome biogenesis GTPase Der [Phycisphaerales bacterium]|nr:ribosome biogenesis GTPase Der [Phycisphaerales bacterium]
MRPMPVVAIVGRPNVGKSSLLNALTQKRIAIVQDMPGVTRDRIAAPLKVADRFVELVDTGGYGFVDADQLTDHIHHQIELAMARANMVLFIVDCADGLTSADEQIAALLRRRNVKTILVANKADNPKADVALGDFARLGLGTPVGVSAMNGRNVEQVLEAIERNVDLSEAPTEIPPPQMLLAIVGKRNAGKSTLVNAIARLYEGDADRVIVSEVPGTTRDSVDVRFDKEGKSLVVIDTAGVRKKRRMVTNDIEFYSFHRAQRSIRRSDVVLMLIDGTEPISEPDKKLAQYIAEQYKPVLLVVNKWDLTREKIRELRKLQPHEALEDRELMEEYRQYLDAEIRHLNFAPIAFITARESRNIQSVIDLSQHLYHQTNQRLTTGRLNLAVRQILEERFPSTTSGRRARIYYATQTDVAPPTVVLFVNNPAFFDDSYQRFMINRFRELLPYPEVPIKLVIRPRQQGGKAPSLDELPDEDIDQPDKPVQFKPKPKPKSRKPVAAKPRRSETKPRPKSTRSKGPLRGRRPG